MTSDELLDRLTSDCEQPRDFVRDVLQALADVIATELTAGRPATISGLGSFRPMERPGKTPRMQVSWRADPRLAQALRAIEVRAALAETARIPGERKARAYTKRVSG